MSSVESLFVGILIGLLARSIILSARRGFKRYIYWRYATKRRNLGNMIDAECENTLNGPRDHYSPDQCRILLGKLYKWSVVDMESYENMLDYLDHLGQFVHVMQDLSYIEKERLEYDGVLLRIDRLRMRLSTQRRILKNIMDTDIVSEFVGGK